MDGRRRTFAQQLGRFSLLALSCIVASQVDAVVLSGPIIGSGDLVSDSNLSGFGGTATYTGSLGPVSADHLICICVATDPALHNLLGCFEVDVNGGRYDVVTMDTALSYLVGF